MNDMASGPTTIVLTTDDPTHCAEALMHLYGSQLPPDTDLVVVCHGDNASDVAQLVHSAGHYPGPGNGAVTVTDMPRLVAINSVIAAMSVEETVRHAVILDQTIRVAPGWMQGLLGCLAPNEVHHIGGHTTRATPVSMVGPCLDQTGNDAQRIELQEQEVALGLTAYAAARLSTFGSGMASAAEVLDGSCVLVSAATIQACTRTGDLLNVDCGEWAWADLALRASRYGCGICAVSEQVFVARDGVVPPGSHVAGDIKHRLAFYAAHPAKDSYRAIAVVPVRLQGWQDIQRLKAAMIRMASVVDGIAFVLCSNPLNVLSDPARPSKMAAVDVSLMKSCKEATAVQLNNALAAWAHAVINKVPGNDLGKDSIWCNVYEAVGADDVERQQRNLGLQMARDMNADAIVMLDSDEMIEYAFTRDQLQRVLRHPNPMVRCFDASISYAWDAPTLVRVDAPWGHGGVYQGGAHGPRIYRCKAGEPVSIRAGSRPGALRGHGVSAHRVAALRLRRFRFSRPSDRVALSDSGEGISVSQWQIDNRIGMHMLVWGDESPEDIARWLDDVHGLVDHVVLVWTDPWREQDQAWREDPEKSLVAAEWPETGPCRALAAVGHMHGVQWVHKPLDDNIAEARNAGIDALNQHGGLAWAWFMDPDEWLGDRLADCITLRHMATSSRWGWLMQVANYRADKGTPTISDSVRISRLDDECTMRMNGRVHEGFHHSIQALQAKNIHPRLVYAPFVVQHRGMAFNAEAMSAKLDKYDRLLRLQLADDPRDPGSWVSLGWQYFNDGHEQQGVECYERALKCAGTSYLPFKEMAYVHLRKARELMHECNGRLATGHQFAELAQHIGKWLNQYAPPHQIVERPDNWDGGSPSPLPEWVD